MLSVDRDIRRLVAARTGAATIAQRNVLFWTIVESANVALTTGDTVGGKIISHSVDNYSDPDIDDR